MRLEPVKKPKLQPTGKKVVDKAKEDAFYRKKQEAARQAEIEKNEREFQAKKKALIEKKKKELELNKKHEEEERERERDERPAKAIISLTEMVGELTQKMVDVSGKNKELLEKTTKSMGDILKEVAKEKPLKKWKFKIKKGRNESTVEAEQIR